MNKIKENNAECPNELEALRAEVARLRKAETFRRQAEESLRKSEQCYRAIANAQTELISHFMRDFTHSFVNEAYCRYLGKTWQELIGQNILNNIPEEDRHLFLEQIVKISPQQPAVCPEHRIITKDGEARWINWSTRAIFNDSGQLVEYQSVGRCIPERELMEEDLKTLEKMINIYSRLLEHKIAAQREILNQIRIEKQKLREGKFSKVKKLLIPILRELNNEMADLPQVDTEFSVTGRERPVTMLESINSFADLRLSKKEIEICQMIKEGMTTSEIARGLNVSINTINSHRNNVRRKVNINNEKINLTTFLKSIDIDR